MSRSLAASVLLALVACSGCAEPIRAWASYDDGVEWSKYKTWAWCPEPAEPQDTGGVLEINLRRIKVSLAEAIFTRGAKMAPFEQADLLVAFHANVSGMAEMRDRRMKFGYDMGTGAPAPTGLQTGEGLLIVDVLTNTKPPRLIWQGMAGTQVTRGLDPEETQARIQEIVAAIVAQYPPGRQQP